MRFSTIYAKNQALKINIDEVTVILRRKCPKDLSKSALRRPKRSHIKPKSVKNVRPDGMGDQIGRLHIDKQDLGKMAKRRFKAFKGKKEAVRD